MTTTELGRPLTIRAHVPGAARVDVRELGGRTIVWLDVDAAVRKGALSSEASSMIEAAAVVARANGYPLVATMDSSGADIAEGFGALHGWGLAAKALTSCSGIVPTLVIVDGPAVSGPALLIGI